jgi:hypothetical protein
MTVAARTIVRLFFGRGVFDVNCPYRMMRADLFKEHLLRMPSHTFAPNVMVSALVCNNNYRVLEIPVVHSQRTTGQVSIRKSKLLKVAVRSLWQTMLFRFHAG